MLSRQFSKIMFRSQGNSFFNICKYHQIRKIVRVSTIDHDACFGLQYMAPNQFNLMHAPVIEFMKEQKKMAGYDVDYVMSYSNRQSIPRDCFNAIKNQNNLAFPIAISLAKTLNAYFDPLLLADIYARKKPGFTVRCMLHAASKRNVQILKNRIDDNILYEIMNESRFDYIFSEDKINILYAQVHRIALIHPEAIIHFHIYDDLINQVLQASMEFYKKYPTLIPDNVILCFHYFDTLENKINLPISLYTLTGEGVIDVNYYNTVILMGDIAKKEEGKHKSKYRMALYMSPEKMGKTFLKEYTGLPLGLGNN